MIERIGLSARSARTKRSGHLQGACLIAASALLIVLTTATLAAAALGQPPRPAANSAAPMPDVGNLLREVTARQKSIEQLREDYDYTEVSETREFDGSGRLKETKTEEYQIFFVNGRHIRRLVKRDGKPLDASEEKKEQERVSKEINKASKDSLEDRQNKDAVSLSRIVENSNWSNARRLLYNGRSTLAYDFTSNPHARTQTRAEDVFKDLSGTVWIDEKDRTIVRLAAHFAQDFHVGAGLLASVHKAAL